LLPEGIAAVAREALGWQRQLVTRVGDALHDPTRVIPEGVDVDSCLDLSSYAARVIGFERYRGRQRPLIHDSSGIDWHLPPDDSAFLRLPFRRQEDNSATYVAVTTEADARGLLNSIEGALVQGGAEPPA